MAYCDQRGERKKPENRKENRKEDNDQNIG
jgi:hypothetical protein